MKTHKPLCQNFNKIYSFLDRYKIRGEKPNKRQNKNSHDITSGHRLKIEGGKNVLSPNI